MKVYKFGGASLKDAESIKNVTDIIANNSGTLIVIVSAIGKTTNKLENAFFALEEKNYSVYRKLINEFYLEHLQIIDKLFITKQYDLLEELEKLIVEINDKVYRDLSDNRDFEYDQIVGIGEIFSSKIIELYINNSGINSEYIDARTLIKTDDNFRNANVDLEKTANLIKDKCKEIENIDKVYVSQGFIGSTVEGFTTTLGRDGSDYSAALFSYAVEAENLTIWKDVPGVLNADPKWFDNTVKLNHISFQEAIELAYYGANVIHPKTIKPLQNKQISLFVKSFVFPTEPGTVINEDTVNDYSQASFIFKMNQLKLSLTPKDFSFIAEDKLSIIFGRLSKVKAHINLMQNSAISFDVVINNNENLKELLHSEFDKDFNIQFEEQLELVTIRHYDEETISRVTENKEIILTQQSKNTSRILMKDKK
jgi:aspartate kinase